jgi:flavin reductase (DIM6/NTAB) family NADH-FMN oxidoreductase RutF
MARFATGVTVVTTTLDHAYFGLTVNAFCSVSLNPPLILVSLDLRSQTYASIRQSGVFAVNLLTQQQEPLAVRFARKDLSDKTFDDIAISVGETTGVPLFADALARIECRVSTEYPGGDHALMLGEVVSVSYSDDLQANEPLLYYRSTFWVTPQESAASKPSNSAVKPAALHPVELFPLPFVFSLEV